MASRIVSYMVCGVFQRSTSSVTRRTRSACWRICSATTTRSHAPSSTPMTRSSSVSTSSCWGFTAWSVSFDRSTALDTHVAAQITVTIIDICCMALSPSCVTSLYANCCCFFHWKQTENVCKLQTWLIWYVTREARRPSAGLDVKVQLWWAKQDLKFKKVQLSLCIILFQEERGQVLTTTGLIIAVRMLVWYFAVYVNYTGKTSKSGVKSWTYWSHEWTAEFSARRLYFSLPHFARITIMDRLIGAVQ